MSLIPFPNIPKLPGVPAIPRSPNFPPTTQAVLGIVQGTLWRIAQTQTQWGIFDANGKPLADPSKFSGITGQLFNSVGGLVGLGVAATSSTNSVEYSRENRVSDFPVEKGSFATYNKVVLPANPIVTLCMEGSESDRKKFLNAIETASGTTDLYNVVTPEVQYIGYNIETYNYARRASRGATLLVVEITLKEVREVSVQFAQASTQTPIDAPKDSGATPPVDNGKVQAKTPNISTLKSLSNQLPQLTEKISSFLQSALK